GPPNVDVEVTPGETRDYIITVRDPEGDETMHFWTMEVYQADIFDDNGNYGARLAQQPAADKLAFSMNVTPNPSTGVFMLSTASPVNGSLQVIDVTGKQVYEAQLTAENSNYSIDLTNFASGIYMLIVNSDQGHYESKLVRE
ncbi:MAG: T9SS type A sorting domain-containing protein, partial [Bacteroidia bacterium]